MLGRHKPVTFDPYGRRRSRRVVPRWLWLMLFGALIGAVGVIYVQESHMPERLTPEQSTRLRALYDRAEGERLRLEADLADATKELAAERAARESLENSLSADRQQFDTAVKADRQTIERLRQDIAMLVAALPPDPRGGEIEVRAGRIANQGGALAYEVVLTRGGGGRPVAGVVQFSVAGENARGVETTVTLDPVKVRVGSYESVRGSQPLPEGFVPRQTTVSVLDGADGRRLGMRVLLVR